ncbi:MAG: hypothetical protein ACMG6H_17360 [Acidobacteriota bacterium]
MSDQNESGGANQSQQNEPDLYAARIIATRETFGKLMQQFELDVGCRHPHVDVNPDGTSTMLVYATEDRIRRIRDAGYKVEQGENVSALGRERQGEVGEGDRFAGGRVAPRGLGLKSGRIRKGGSR